MTESGILDEIVLSSRESYRQSFDNVQESLAKCTSLIQDTAARIDNDQKLLRVLEDAHKTLSAALLTRPTGKSTLIFPSLSTK